MDIHPALLAGLGAVVWEINPHTLALVRVGEAIESMSGYPASRWLGCPTFWLEAIHPDDRRRVRDACLRAAGHCELDRIEFRLTTADGRTRWITAAIQPVCEDGRARRLVGAWVDVSEHHEL